MMFLEVKCYDITTYFQMIKEKILREREREKENKCGKMLTISGFKCTVEIFQNKKLRKTKQNLVR